MTETDADGIAIRGTDGRDSGETDRSAAISLVTDSAAPIRYVADESVVDIATGDLQDDIERVTGQRPTRERGLEDCDERAIIVGTYGVDDAFDRALEQCLAAHESGDDALEGPESYLIAAESAADDADATVPFGADEVLLIAGSDPRGTAYGVYEFARKIGVSPWYWWADVSTADADELHVRCGLERSGPPSVRYRGVFINDEDFGIREWAQQTHEPEVPDGIGPKTYERLFELLLRLKANTIWPAMHDGTKAFYFCDGNKEAADRYHIIVGTSHCEPMHRNNVGEWELETHGEWNYETNAETIRQYWSDRVADVADTENLFTIGMRGIHDSGMPGGDTLEERADLLQQVIDDQREILDESHESPVESVPQIFCPYKETLEIYREGVDVPDDVCLVWPDDNFGYMRRLPRADERTRAGGHGVYYHLSYWGRPHDHQWLCSIPPALIRQELVRAYRYGADTLWIANVGDLKPAEKETEYFLELAWDLEATAANSETEWLTAWAAREFGPAHADDIAEILAEYYRLALARKPEHLGWNSVYPNTEKNEPEFSAIAHGDEAERRLEDYERIDERAADIASSLPDDSRTAFFHLVEYPIRAARSINEGVLTAMRSRLYAGRGRTGAETYAQYADNAFAHLEAATRQYNARSDGKWRRILSASPRELPAFDLPATGRVTDTQDPTLEVTVEGEAGVAGTGPQSRGLPTIVQGLKRRRFIDCYNRGSGEIEWEATTNAEWLSLGQTAGTFEEDERLWVGVDWEHAPAEPTSGTIQITGAGRELEVSVPIRPRPLSVVGEDEPETRTPLFVESNDRIALEAEQSTALEQGDTRWEPVDGLSRTTGKTMVSRPLDGPRLAADAESIVADAARLEYDLEISSAVAEVCVEVQLLPTHAPTDETPHRYAVAVGDGEPTVVDFDANSGEHDPQWQENVLRSSAYSRTHHEVSAPGRQTLSVYAVDPSVVIDRIVVYTNDDTRRSSLGPRDTRDRRLE